jgi:transposase
MAEINYTTRVYQYGAVPLGPFPEEGVEFLYKANALWNRLVEIHNDSLETYDQARRDADKEYDLLSQELEKLEDNISKAFTEKRNARMKARTRSSSNPLIKAANDKISGLRAERKGLWDQIKPARKRATDLIDKKVLNDAFNSQVKAALSSESTGGLDRNTADEVNRYFREARDRVFNTPNSRLRKHRFDGTGYRFFRFRDQRVQKKSDGTKYSKKTDGVTFDYFTPLNDRDERAFLLTPNTKNEKKPRLKLQVKIGERKKGGKSTYAYFDIVYHRPIPEGAQINNAKLMRRRVGDHFKYTVNFSVRVPEAKRQKPKKHALGVDIGFRRLPDGGIRAAMIGSTDPSIKFESIGLSPDYVKRLDHIEDLMGQMDASATKLGKELKTSLKAGAVISKDHKRYGLVRGVANLPSNITMSFEQAYKMASWFKTESDTLPEAAQSKLMEWWDKHYQDYREMHHLRKKTLGWRKEEYRILAARLVSYGMPIGIERIDLSVFAEVKDKDNELSDEARSQRFMVSNSELIGAIKNAAQREGVECIEINPKNTSKTCSACGVVQEQLKAELRWECASCGAKHDRDENATINISREAMIKMTKPKAKKAKKK